MKMLLLYALNPNSASCSMQTRVLEKINSHLATNRTKNEKIESVVGVTTIKEISKVWDGISLAAATKNKTKTKKKKHEFLVPIGTADFAISFWPR